MAVILENIHKTFNMGSINENHVLRGLNLKLEKGDFVTVIGGNGSGKSTLLNVIAGTVKPEEGDVSIDEMILTKMSVKQRAKYIGRVFQDPRMGSATKLSIEENLAIASKRGNVRGFAKGVSQKDKGYFIERLKMLDLGLENRLKVEMGLLSGGQRQAITLLMATLKIPEILLLDEHTAALDPKTSKQVLEITDRVVKKDSITTMMITHDMENAIRYGNRLIMLNGGKVVVDVCGEEKKHLTVPDLIELFHKNSGDFLNDDSLILG